MESGVATSVMDNERQKECTVGCHSSVCSRLDFTDKTKGFPVIGFISKLDTPQPLNASPVLSFQSCLNPNLCELTVNVTCPPPERVSYKTRYGFLRVNKVGHVDRDQALSVSVNLTQAHKLQAGSRLRKYNCVLWGWILRWRGGGGGRPGYKQIT